MNERSELDFVLMLFKTQSLLPIDQPSHSHRTTVKALSLVSHPAAVLTIATPPHLLIYVLKIYLFYLYVSAD